MAGNPAASIPNWYVTVAMGHVPEPPNAKYLQDDPPARVLFSEFVRWLLERFGGRYFSTTRETRYTHFVKKMSELWEDCNEIPEYFRKTLEYIRSEPLIYQPELFYFWARLLARFAQFFQHHLQERQ